MGITHFCKLLEHLQDYPSQPAFFDSVLYDIQSELHAAIHHSTFTTETQLLHDIPGIVWKNFYRDLLTLLPFASDPVTLIVSFDGEGVPMKWPTQEARRSKCSQPDPKLDIKSVCRMVLFGNNVIAIAVQKHLLKQFKVVLKEPPFDAKISSVYISGCNVPGEGEHKIFHMAEKLALRHPIVASIDQDVFVLALLRMQRYNTLQIYRYNRFYPVIDIYRRYFCATSLEVCSFLFGNDFIPPLVSISPTNANTIYRFLEHEGEQHPVPILANFIRNMTPHLRYQPVTHVDTLLVECFWITFFWLRDYYTTWDFPQKYINNLVYRHFDRNQLLTALSEPDMACYERALDTYNTLNDTCTTPQQARYAVFKNDRILDQLKSYWVSPSDEKCIVLRVSRTR